MNCKIEVRLFAYLRDGRGKSVKIDASTVKEALDILGIPQEDAHIILINGRDSLLSSPLKEGDILSIFPQVGGG